MRWSLAVVAAALVCASACGGVVSGAGPSDARGGAGGGGGAANVGTGGATLGGAGTIGVGGAGGQGGEQACDSSTAAACACDSQAAACQPVLMTACLGQHCPPSLDDARLVANWTALGSASGPAVGRARGYYNECPDGSRWFSFWQDSGSHGFGFDGGGRLITWYTLDGGSCAQLVCGGDTVTRSSCTSCNMFSDPQPEGTFLIPRGISNGPTPNCEVDANGRWVQPHLAPAN